MKKIIKALSTVGLASTLLFTNGVSASTSVHYQDVKPTDNFYKSVEYLLEKNAISKTLPNFRPYDNITRGQFASIIAKVMGLSTKSQHIYVDVPTSHQFYPYVQMVVAKGLMSGKTNKEFGLNDSLTRGQMAGILASYFRLPLISAEEYKDRGGKKSDIFDGTQFKGTWGQHIATLETLGVMSGYTDGTYKQNKAMNRSQFANMIRLLDNDFITIHKYDIAISMSSTKDLEVSAEDILKELRSLENENVLKLKDTFTEYYYHYTEGTEYGYEEPDKELVDTYIFSVMQEGEIVFDDLNIRMIVERHESNYLSNYYTIKLEKLEEGETTSTSDTATK
nr:S-layer homology domain-containing protein [Lysinibacillus timonensis]